MNPSEEPSLSVNELHHATVHQKKGFSIVWLIPLVAIVIGAGLVFKALSEKGPTITINFESAEGLEAGKTKIKYKDVEIGKVESIKLSKDLKHVIITAELIKEANAYLNTNTRFWVVRARFAGGVASGLGTLLSGSYIEIDPGREGNPQKDFTGLEIPPIVTSDLPGSHFKLRAPKLGSLQHGSPIYFKGFKVGEVEGYRFSDQGDELEIEIFIEEPYDKNIYNTTRFWFSSGIDVVLDAKGVRIDTQSVVSMIIGGISFTNLEQIRKGSLASQGMVFKLYHSSQDAMEEHYTQKDYYLLKFNHSVRGLAIGAPVEFRGFPIGEVVDIWLERDSEENQIIIPVKIEVEPERIKQLSKADSETRNVALETMVEQGMRAQLKTGNLLTGSLYVALDIFSTADPATLVVHGDIIEIPTIPATMDELTENLTALMDRFSKIPVGEISDQTIKMLRGLDEASKSFKNAGDGISELVSSESAKKAVNALNQSLEQIKRLTSEMEQQLPDTVSAVSKQTITTLSGIEKLTASDSEVVFELKRALKEFTQAARSIKILADQLERHPESLITGKGEDK